MKKAYKRVLLKISGEALMGKEEFGVHPKACSQIAAAIKEVSSEGIQMGIVVGGGNIFRGQQAQSFSFARTPADQIGMLATVINGLILQQSLERLGCPARVMSAIGCEGIVESYNWHAAIHALEKGSVVIFAGGTGNPYFTTDTAAALRASEINAEVLVKATKVDGVYSDDPVQNPKATKYQTLTYAEAIEQQLKVMDMTALALCREQGVVIRVVKLSEIARALLRQEGGTLVTGG